MKIGKLAEEEIMAVLPVYVDGKQRGTKVYTKKGGKHIIKKGFNSIRRELCKYFHIDLKAVRNEYEKYSNMKGLIPIPFTPEDIFIYVKVLEPEFKNDEAFGILNIKYIDGIRSNEKTIIDLTNNVEIECLNSIKTVKKHIGYGKIVKELYNKKIDSLNKLKDNKVVIVGDVLFMGEKGIEERMYGKELEIASKLTEIGLSSLAK